MKLKVFENALASIKGKIARLKEGATKRKVFGIALIILGVVVIGSALYMRYSADKQQRDMIAGFEKTLQEMGQDDGNTNISSNSGNETEVKEDPSRPGSINNNALAILEVPKIDLTVAVMEGTEGDAIKYAVGHFENTAMPGEKGNFCVAGHRNYTYNEYFNRLDELNTGDIIKARTEKGTFEYEVYEKKVVEPTEVSVLNPTEDATVTLVTCTPVRVATHRLIVKGRLKS